MAKQRFTAMEYLQAHASIIAGKMTVRQACDKFDIADTANYHARISMIRKKLAKKGFVVPKLGKNTSSVNLDDVKKLFAPAAK